MLDRLVVFFVIGSSVGWIGSKQCETVVMFRGLVAMSGTMVGIFVER